VKATKELLGLPADETFFIPDDVLEHYRAAGTRGAEAREDWERRLEALDAERRADWDTCQSGRGVAGWEAKLPTWEPGEKVATRASSADCINAIIDVVPGLLPGSADLTGNTGVELKDGKPMSLEDPGARQIHYGIREHAMGAACVGMAMHKGVLPVGATFFVFSDYMRGAVRLSALSEAHVVYSWTHDSVGLGEDGPTHQPIEHLASLRAMPGLRVIRPADANESAQAWRVAVDHDGPSALILTRQGLPVLEGTDGDGLERGAYVLVDAPDGEAPELVLVGTGSEVQLCVGAAERLAEDGTAVQVVSMPCWELFAEQSEEYQDVVLPVGVPTLAVEAGSSFGWERYADDTVTHDGFGASAPGATALAEMGFTVDNVVDRAQALLDGLS
jgi:transketolase